MPSEEREPAARMEWVLDGRDLEHRLTTIEVSADAGFARISDEIRRARDEITKRQDIANGRTDKLEGLTATMREDMKVLAPTVAQLREDVNANTTIISVLKNFQAARNVNDGTLFVITRKNLAAFAAAMVAMIPIVATLFNVIKDQF